MKGRKVILGLVSKYPLYFIRPFFDSLKKTGYNDEVVIFTNDVESQVLKFFKEKSIHFFNYNSEWPYVDDERLKPFVRKCNITLSPNSLRYILYEAYLKSFAGEFDWVLISDVRDVYFQRDPFMFQYKPGISVFLEDAGTTIGQQFHNSNWIIGAFGESEWRRLSDKPISCSGVTIGDTKGVVNYLERMNDLIIQKANIPGLDQGIHNYLLHTNELRDATIYSDDSGPVSTISVFKPKKSIKVTGGKVVGIGGQTVNIVHQYDRYNSLLIRWNFRYFLRHQINLFKGTLLRFVKKIK